MESTNSQPNILIIEAKKADGSQNASIKIPLGILHFAIKILKLLPTGFKENIDRVLAHKGLGDSFDSLLAEGNETLIYTLRKTEVEIQDEKQKFKLSIV